MVAFPASFASLSPSLALLLAEPRMSWSAASITAALWVLIVPLILLSLLLLCLLVSAGPQRSNSVGAALFAGLFSAAELDQLLDVGDSLHVGGCKTSFLHISVPQAGKGHVVDSLLHERDVGVTAWRWAELC